MLPSEFKRLVLRVVPALQSKDISTVQMIGMGSRRGKRYKKTIITLYKGDAISSVEVHHSTPYGVEVMVKPRTYVGSVAVELQDINQLTTALTNAADILRECESI